MKIIKNLNKQIVKKWLWYIVIFIISIYILVWMYSLAFEQDKLEIDRYNFWQLEKVKLILKNVPEKEMDFYTIKKFNEIYNADIKPIKNCYVISDSNWDKPYIFWFQLESMIYRFIYIWKNYAYPSYSRPSRRVCFGEYTNWSIGGCSYTNKQPFIDTISIII